MYFLRSFSLFLFFLFISVNSYCQFLGGSGSGDSFLGISPSPCSAISVNSYAGGSSDGDSYSGISPTPCPAISVNPFFGGTSDGHSNGDLSPTPCPAISVNPYFGGNADGHSDNGISPSPCAAISVNPFVGGIANGNSAMYLINDFTCAPLPVELIFFNAYPNGKNVDVVWSTASEWNAQHYRVQRSKDGANYEFVAEVPAAGTSSTLKEYETVDAEPYQGISYYKLRQVDLNGGFKDYGPVAVKFSLSEMAVYPNVSSGVFYISCNEKNTDIQIYSTDGNVIFESFNRQFSSLQVDISAQPSGIYYVIVRSGKETLAQKIVVSR